MNTVRVLLAALLIPACAALTRTVAGLLVSSPSGGSAAVPAPAAAFLAGMALWLAMFYLLPRPVRSYILAHELTHALWAAVMGAKVSGLRVSKNRGSVKVSETNFMIALAPYFFPLYTVAVITAYYIVSLFIDVSQYFLPWMGLVGFTWGFHVTFTLDALGGKQDDVERYGRLFSYVAIYLLNLAGVAVWIVIVSSATLEGLAQGISRDFAWAYGAVWRWAAAAAALVFAKIRAVFPKMQ